VQQGSVVLILITVLSQLCFPVLCDTHDTSILIVDTYVTIPVSPRYIVAVQNTVTTQVSRVSTIPCSSYHLATCTLQACDAETNSKVAENHNYYYHCTTMETNSKVAENHNYYYHCTTMNARAAVNKYNPISYFCISVGP